MESITVLQMPAFKRSFKKPHASARKIVTQAITALTDNPKIGQAKKGDLEGIYVYKFKISNQEYLIAYEWSPHQRILIALGVHENFYRDIKR
jgi:mRNA-degrading endonuclease RelE of RelBE toxin-antitoxin system